MEDLIGNVNLLAVVIATLLYFFLGALWYSPLLFANEWMKLRNLSEDDIGKPNPVIFLYSFILQSIAVLTLALFLSAMEIDTALSGGVIGLGAGAGLVFTLAGTTGIFSETPLKLHFIDNGYHVIGLTVAGAILGAW